MASWVRYSVAVYIGLLLAGSLMASKQASAWPWKSQRRAAVQAKSTPPKPPDKKLNAPDKDNEPLDPDWLNALPRAG